MSRSDARVLTLVGAVSVASATALALMWHGQGAPGSRDMLQALTLGVFMAMGRLFPLPVAFRRRMVTDTAPLFAASLLLPVHLVALTAVVAIAPSELITGLRSRLYVRQVVFNTCQAMIGVVAAAAVFNVASGEVSFADPNGMVVIGVLAAAAAMLVVNDVLIFAVVWAQMGLRFDRMLSDYFRGRNDLPFDLALYAAGALGAVVGSGHPLFLWVLALPLPVVYTSMRNHVALRAQTREAVIALADIVDERDPYTFGHCKRVAEFTGALCRQMGLSHDVTDEIVLAARVHDVGKIGIRDAVLLKPSKLTALEYDHIKQHPDIGARLTARFPDFSKGTKYIRHHHEKWDGSGYPSGLRGREIPLGARVIAVADTYDAITSTRVYRDGLGDEFAQEEMARVAGTQLDPEVVDAWFAARGWDTSAPGKSAPGERPQAA